MCYKLTLSLSEREAFRFIGDRYATGMGVARLLYLYCMFGGDQWEQEGNITFDIPEHIAWQIQDLSEQEEHRWPFLSSELADKMRTLVESIV